MMRPGARKLASIFDAQLHFLNGMSIEERRFPSRLASMIWIFAAALSILTTRYILLDLQWHYPWFLTLAQGLCYLLWISIRAFKNVPPISSPQRQQLYAPGADIKEHLRTIALACSGLSLVLSLSLFSQALLHHPNTMSLVMLTPLAYLPSLVVNALREPIVTRSRSRTRLIIFTLAIANLFYWDYRLAPNGLIFTISAIGLFGVLQTSSGLLRPDLDIATTKLGQVATLMLSLPVVLYCSHRYEGQSMGLNSLSHLPWSAWFAFSLNISCTCLALDMGCSNIIYVAGDRRPPCVGVRLHTWTEMVPSLAMTSLVAVVLAIYQASIIGPFQILAYAVAVTCLVDVDIWQGFDAVRSGIYRPRHVISCMKHAYLDNVEDEDKGHHMNSLIERIEDDDDDDDVSYIGETASTKSERVLQNRLVPRILELITLVSWVIIVWYQLISTSVPVNLFPHPFLDTDYRANSTIDVVISMYSEPLEEILRTISLVTSIPTIGSHSPRIFIYNKNSNNADRTEDQIASGLTTTLRQNLHFTTIPNIGREGETYLHHILTEWDNLGNHTIFLQAETHNARETLPRIRDYYGSDTGMLSLSFVGNTCACNSAICTDRFWTDDSGIVRETYLRANRLEQCPSPSSRILLSYKGQFVASAARIRGVQKSVYEDLEALFLDENAFVHREGYLKGREEEMSAPIFGFTMERMWSSLLQCSDEEIARKCPSLLSGWRWGGSREDCQCLDRV